MVYMKNADSVLAGGIGSASELALVMVSRLRCHTHFLFFLARLLDSDFYTQPHDSGRYYAFTLDVCVYVRPSE